MKELWIALGLGVGAGILDIIPMIIQKLDKYSIISAFFQWIVLGIIIKYSSVLGLKGWANGAVVAVIAAIPIVILVSKSEPKSVGIILGTSLVLGAVVGYFSECL